jgi:hypothetical protein
VGYWELVASIPILILSVEPFPGGIKNATPISERPEGSCRRGSSVGDLHDFQVSLFSSPISKFRLSGRAFFSSFGVDCTICLLKGQEQHAFPSLNSSPSFIYLFSIHSENFNQDLTTLHYLVFLHLNISSKFWL